MRQVNYFLQNSPHKLRFVYIFGFLGYLLFPLYFPLLPYFDDTPQYDIRSFTPSLLQGLFYGLLLVALFLLYRQGYKVVRHHTISLAHLVLWVGATAVPLLLTYPINATDVYRYFIRGRIMSVYGESQYRLPPAAFAADPFTPLAGEWVGATSPYGPVWELVATAVTFLVQDNLLFGLLSFKLLGLLTHLAITILIWYIHSGTAQQQTTAWLWGANPALLLTFVVNAHNDALMLFWLVLAIFLIRTNRLYWGLAAAILAPLVKSIGLLALPFVGLLVWRRQPSWRARLLSTAVALVLGSIFAAWTFLPFGSPLDLVERLSQELTSGASFSPFTLLILLLRNAHVTLPFDTLLMAGQVGLVLVLLGLIGLTLNGRSPIRAMSDIFTAYIIQAFNFRIWYASWTFPWVLMDDPVETWRVKTAVYFLLTTQLSVLIYGHLRFYALGGNQLYTHLIGVPFTFFLPPLLAMWGSEEKTC